MVTPTQYCEASSCAGHGDIEKAAGSVTVLDRRFCLPTSIQNHDVIELETLCPVRGQKQKALLFASGLSSPLRKPLDEIGN